MSAVGWRVPLLATLVLAWPTVQAAPAVQVSLDHPDLAVWRFLKRASQPSPGLIGPFPAVWGHVAVVRLPRRHTDLVVVQSSKGDCGSGGCWLDVYESARGGGPPFRVRGGTSINLPPVRLLPTTHHGLPDLVVRSQYYTKSTPDGPTPHVPVVLSFDGRSYPDNPSVPPARLAKRWESHGGTLLVPDYPLGDRRQYGLVLTPAGPAPAERK